MSKLRQEASFDRRAVIGAPVTTLSYCYQAKYRVPRHFHEFAQVLYAVSGAMTVTTDMGMWVIPPERAVWIPAGVEHSIFMHSMVWMKSVYLRPRLVRSMPHQCTVLNIAPLLRELLIRACEFPVLSLRSRKDASLIAMLLQEVEAATHLPLQLTLPTDTRALRVAQALITDPRQLQAASDASGASRRTLERIFARETGISFGQWRQQLILVRAVRLLGEGMKVTAVAEECGYASPSAFVAMFRKRLGVTPAQYPGGRGADLRNDIFR
jgi:AraC-like DNA-binding protein